MKNIFFIAFLSFLAFTNSLPHFIYDGIESYHECLEDKEKFSFSIYGSLSDESNINEMFVKNYLIDDMGEFKCDLLTNEENYNKKRSHKIVCSIMGTFERKGYIIEEPIVYGFDFKNEKGESTWPKEHKKKTFLMGKCGEKIELDNEPILLGNLGAYVNPINKIRKNIVDNALSSLPSRSSVTESDMIESMKTKKKTYSLSDFESAYMVYKWEAQNIAYDCYNYYHSPSNIDFSEKGTYTKGKGVCAGIAAIFETMVNGLGIEAFYVIGYSKGASFVPGTLPSKTDHAWNAIKVSGSYYLIDATWGSGTCKNDQYEANLRDSYFCTNPEIFIRSHLPAEEKYQLISPTITLAKFVSMLNIGIEFYDKGFKSVSPDLAKFNTDGKFTISFTYESEPRKTILTNLYFVESNTYIQNSCWVERQKETAQLTCYANNEGQYKLQIFGGPANLESYPFLMEYQIVSTKTALTPMGFPTTYGLFENSDLQLINPLYNPLKRGNFFKFEFKTTTFDNLYIINNKHFRELDNNGNGLITGEDVYIFGQEVYVATLKDGYYNYIIKYTTIRDSSQSTDASFPEAYGAPKNILYSPLYSNLQIGVTYLFRIKCESAEKMAVVEGNTFTYLTKSGSIFSGRIKVNGNTNTLSIVMVSGNSYTTFYRYQLNN